MSERILTGPERRRVAQRLRDLANIMEHRLSEATDHDDGYFEPDEFGDVMSWRETSGEMEFDGGPVTVQVETVLRVLDCDVLTALRRGYDD